MRPVSLAVIGLLAPPRGRRGSGADDAHRSVAAARGHATAGARPSAGPGAAATARARAGRGRVSLRVDSDTLAHRKLRVRGTLRPAIGGQQVTVTIKRGGHTLRSVTVRAGRDGSFLVGYTPKTGGRLHVRAVHQASAEVGAARARTQYVDVIVPHAAPGSRGASVRWLQSRLAGLHYSVSRNGRFDDATGRAVLAYRKLNGLARTQSADTAVFARLARGQGAFQVRYPGHGRHVEADLSHQVLALINPGGKVYRIYPTSSGKPSTPTVLGHFRVYMKTPGTNAKGMVHSNYFIRGYAIHGYAEVPTYPASHGCLRVPVPNSSFIYGWVRIGTPVDVYYR